MPGVSPWYIRWFGKYTALVYMTSLLATSDFREEKEIIPNQELDLETVPLDKNTPKRSYIKGEKVRFDRIFSK